MWLLLEVTVLNFAEWDANSLYMTWHCGEVTRPTWVQEVVCQGAESRQLSVPLVLFTARHCAEPERRHCKWRTPWNSAQTLQRRFYKRRLNMIIFCSQKSTVSPLNSIIDTPPPRADRIEGKSECGIWSTIYIYTCVCIYIYTYIHTHIYIRCIFIILNICICKMNVQYANICLPKWWSQKFR